MAIAWGSFTQTAEAMPTVTFTPAATQTPVPTPTFTVTIAPELLTQQAQATLAAEIARYQPIDIRELITYPKNHIGEFIVVTGKVFNVNSDTELQMWVGDGLDAVYVVSREAFKSIYEDDTIKVYAIIFGENCGQNAFGSEVCQPLLMDALIEKQ